MTKLRTKVHGHVANQVGRLLIQLEPCHAAIIKRIQTYPHVTTKGLETFVNNKLGVACSDYCLDQYLIKVGQRAYETGISIVLPIDEFGSLIEKWIEDQPGLPYQTILARLRQNRYCRCSFITLRLYLQQCGLFDKVSNMHSKDEFRPLTNNEIALVVRKM